MKAFPPEISQPLNLSPAASLLNTLRLALTPGLTLLLLPMLLLLILPLLLVLPLASFCIASLSEFPADVRLLMESMRDETRGVVKTSSTHRRQSSCVNCPSRIGAVLKCTAPPSSVHSMKNIPMMGIQIRCSRCHWKRPLKYLKRQPCFSLFDISPSKSNEFSPLSPSRNAPLQQLAIGTVVGDVNTNPSIGTSSMDENSGRPYGLGVDRKRTAPIVQMTEISETIVTPLTLGKNVHAHEQNKKSCSYTALPSR